MAQGNKALRKENKRKMRQADQEFSKRNKGSGRRHKGFEHDNKPKRSRAWFEPSTIERLG